MRVALIVPSFYPAVRYGGPILSTLGLARGLLSQGCEVRVLTTNANGNTTLDVDTSREVELEAGLKVRYTKRVGLDSTAPDLIRLLPRYADWSDVIHLTAVYSFPTLPTLALAKWRNKPLVWAPRGSLQRWTGTAHLGRKRAWELACRAMLPARAILHVTADPERRQARERLPNVPAVIIPNGVNVPADVERTLKPELFSILFLGRLDPIKAVDNLLDACCRLDAPLSWHLTIAGSGETDYVNGLRERTRRNGITEKVTFVGAVSEDERQRLFARSDVLVLPSHSENFGMVVVEALAHGVPVIASRGTPWAELETERCGLWVENSAPGLADALTRARSLPLEEMGMCGRRHVLRHYSWDSVGQRMSDTMRRLVEGSTPLDA